MAGSGTAHLRDDTDLVLRVEHLVVEYQRADGEKVHAVSDVSFDIKRGETLGLVGESGCGKSSVARAVMQIPAPISGRVLLDGKDLTTLSGKALKEHRQGVQMIFQDPLSSVNPLRSAAKVVGEGLAMRGVARDKRKAAIAEVMAAVGLDMDTVGERRAHHMSGGQCQRLCIARAVVLDPDVLVCDEPVSALDVSVQAQILNLLEDMKERYGLTMLFIAHDLAVVKNISDRVAVMYLGKVCEIGDPDALYERPLHPYTAALIAAVPEPDPDVVQSNVELAGEVPSPIAPPSGCRFRTRCPRAVEQCAQQEPILEELRPGQFVACHRPLVDDELVAVSANHQVTMMPARV
jgi:peptide/nickel transport system ATP-binding protein